MINRTDIRSVGSWCKKNDVPVYKDSAGYFVTESEFYNAYDRPVIESYKKRYGDNWLGMYEKCKNGKLLLSLQEEKRPIKSLRYQPKSKLAQDFLGSTKSNSKNYD